LKKLHRTLGKRPFQVNQMKLATSLSVAVTAISILGTILIRGATHSSDAQSNIDANWSELIASMDKMHMAMKAVARSGNPDVDFVSLMVPHHQAAIDMAKTQLLYGKDKDAQMRRLAQEIITDQQLEIELMQRWLKQRESASTEQNQTPTPNTRKDNQR
jgi:uncharacterized protein (DUF305 family)